MIYETIFGLMALGITLSAIRLLKGPTLPDRALATDTANSMVTVVIVLLALYYNNMMFIDVALVYGLLSFLGTLAISKYLLGKQMGDR
jgi:multicomponent Na+:H+ antiporter subunit F